MSYLLTDIDHDSYSSVDGSSDKGSKDQENLDDQEQEVVSPSRRNSRRIGGG